MIDLNKTASMALANALDRQANGANINAETIPMLKHCATEVIEATEAYARNADRKVFTSELADIICCALIIADNEMIDIEKAVLDCLEKNRLRVEGKGDKK